MNVRFYAPEAREPGTDITLPRDEATHLARVLRLHEGDRIRVFNGRGREFDGTVAGVSPNAVTVRLGEDRPPAAEPRVAVTLAQAVLKGDKMDHVVRDAVMMGAAAIRPVVTARAEVGLAALARGRRRERWERIAVASAKQCGRAVVPPVHDPVDLGVLLESLSSAREDPVLWLGEPSIGAAARLGALDDTAPSAVTLVVGPEGGWTPDELERAGLFQVITLGSRVLRADAAALVAMAALFSRWGEY